MVYNDVFACFVSHTRPFQFQATNDMFHIFKFHFDFLAKTRPARGDNNNVPAVPLIDSGSSSCGVKQFDEDDGMS